MTSHLPTVVSAVWTITALRDSLLSHLERDTSGIEIKVFVYAITESGWREIRDNVRQWLSENEIRRVVAFVGTDHGITEAEAIQLMVDDGVDVRLMTSYTGVFHPKVVWLKANGRNTIWIGSNNLTRDGLLNNIEFASILKTRGVPRDLHRWASEVEASSERFSEELLESYKTERRTYNERRVSLGNFTWSRREQRPPQRRSRRTATKRGRSPRIPTAAHGDLIMEVMPRETGGDGKQIQLPIAALRFFGLRSRIGATKLITLTPSWKNEPRTLTMTVFQNSTARLVIRELDYRDRPCLLVFKKIADGTFQFDIVPRGVFPSSYRTLLGQCNAPTRIGSRRWGIVP